MATTLRVLEASFHKMPNAVPVLGSYTIPVHGPVPVPVPVTQVGLEMQQRRKVCCATIHFLAKVAAIALLSTPPAPPVPDACPLAACAQFVARTACRVSMRPPSPQR